MAKGPLHRMAASVCIAAVALILLAMAAVPPLHSQTPRAHGGGYSVPIPVGFHADSASREFARSLWAHGGVLLVHDSAPERIDVIIMPAGPSTAEDAPTTLQKCRDGAAAFVGQAIGSGSHVDLKSVEMAETAHGPACQIISILDAHMASFTFMTTDPLAYGVVCNYDVRDGDTPQWCRDVIDGWRIEPFPWEKTEDSESS